MKISAFSLSINVLIFGCLVYNKAINKRKKGSGLKYCPTQDYSFLLDENHYIYDHVETDESLHIYIK